MVVSLPNQPSFQVSPRAPYLCRHSRIIDSVLTPTGLRTGQVRCLECGHIFDTPASTQEADLTENGTRVVP